MDTISSVEHGEQKIREQMNQLIQYLQTSSKGYTHIPNTQWTYSVTFQQPRPTGDIQSHISLSNGWSTWVVRAAHPLSTVAFNRAINALRLTLSQMSTDWDLDSREVTYAA